VSTKDRVTLASVSNRSAVVVVRYDRWSSRAGVSGGRAETLAYASKEQRECV
jgi:hypothetical protein